MNKTDAGFTLIELLIVISMISILTTMALPSFQDQVIRSQVKEALALSGFVRESIEGFYAAKHRLPNDNHEAGVPDAKKIIGNFVESIRVERGNIHITLGNRINKNAAGKVLTLRPALVPGESMVPLAWVYGYATVPDGMSVSDDNRTTIAPQFLPVNCRY